MIQDPNVERLIRKSIEPLNKQISMLQIELNGVKEQLVTPRVINWVACDKELPLNRRVLAYLVLRNVETTIIASYSEDNGWMSKGERFIVNQITHWAELPKPPCI